MNANRNEHNRARDRRKAASAAIAASLLTLVALACTCGPLNGVLGLRATAQSAQGTLGAFATTIDENLPTLEAELTRVGPTIEAQMTEIGPTLEAQLTSSAPTLEALQTQSGDLLPTLEAQLTELAPTLQAGLEGLGGELSQWASAADASSEAGSDGFSAAQAVGEPNTPECGDFGTAWAAAASEGEAWLNLTYEVPVTPTRIEIHQTYNPGSVFQVEVTIPGGGVSQIVYQGEAQPMDECPYVQVIPISGIESKVGEVTIYVNGADRTEIDAVQLIGTP